MSRLIDADEFEVVGTKVPEGMDPESYMAGMDFVLNKIDEAPTIEPERKKGEWIDFAVSIKGVPTEACGECGEWSLGMGKHFCPNCGADMRPEARNG